MQVREKVRKSQNTVFFPMICGSGASKSRLAKAAGAEPSGQMRWKIARRCSAKHISKSKCTKHTSSGPLFWKWRCRKSVCRCGGKHISKSKCTKHTSFGPLLEVEMPKKCTPLWREAHFQVKLLKTPHVRTTFGSWDVEKVHAVAARSTFRSENVKSTRGSDHFWALRCRFAWQAQGIVDLVKSEKKGEGFVAFSNYNHHYTTHSNTLHYNYNYTFTTFHYTTPHYTPLHSTTLHYTTTQLHYTTLHSTTLHYITLHYAPLH